MMTDSEIRMMRDSVRGMPLEQAAALPIYDGVRGGIVSGGMPAERYHALLDGAAPATPTNDAHRVQAHIDHKNEQLSNAWKGTPVNDNRSPAPQFARDGRPPASLTDAERMQEAHAEYVNGLNDGWRNQ